MASAILGITCLLASSLLGAVDAASFLGQEQPGQVSTAAAETSLAAALAGSASSERLSELEDALRTTYSSLPKGPDGHLGHQGVRYVLHRLFVQRRGWYIKGLEPNGDAPAPYLQGEWVPSYLQGLLEQRFGEQGIDLHELAALAAALEDLVDAEAKGRLENIYSVLQILKDSRIHSDKVDEVLSTYLILYLQNGNFTSISSHELVRKRQMFEQHYAGWAEVNAWMQEIRQRRVKADDDTGLDFEQMSQIVVDMGEHFGTFNDRECRSLKSTLIEMEDRKPARVRLADFYKKGLYSHWEFNEKLAYLRVLGALDESDPSQVYVIAPNYLASRPNCLEASNLYAVCCRDECEELMGHLEKEIAAPQASPDRITALVTALPSDTVSAPRNLSAPLVNRLVQISEKNGGSVPLHGRLFAQWMHHAFPRECPYPHEAGTTSPQTAEEWMKETGEEDCRLSQEEMLAHVDESTSAESNAQAGEMEELPWSSVEQTFESTPLAPGRKKPLDRTSPATIALFLLLPLGGVLLAMAYNTPWRTTALMCAAVGLANFTGVLDTSAFAIVLFGSLFFRFGGPLLAKRRQDALIAQKTDKCCV